MSGSNSTRVFAIVGVAVAGLAGLKALDLAGGVFDVVTLSEPAFAAGEEEEGGEADAFDPRGPLDILNADARDEEAAEQVQAAAECPAPIGIAERSGLSLSELQVLRSLSQRRRDLDAREGAVVEKEGLLAAAETRVEGRIDELRVLEEHVSELLGQLDAAEEAQINALVGLYSRMRSDDAARIFGELEDDVLIDVASRMNEQALAPILADMPGGRAAELTVALARRHVAPSALEVLEPLRDSEG